MMYLTNLRREGFERRSVFGCIGDVGVGHVHVDHFMCDYSDQEWDGTEEIVGDRDDVFRGRSCAVPSIA